MVIICMFFPAVIMCFVRRCLFEKKHRGLADDVKHLAAEYAGSNITINLIIWVALLLTNHERGSVSEKLTNYNVFSIKYLLVAVLLAAALPVAEKYIREKVVFTFEKGKKTQVRIPEPSDRMKRTAVVCLAIIMFLLHFIRIFDNCFWLDEGTAIKAIRTTWSGMLEAVAMYGHAPFHYALLWIFCRVFGYSGPLYHFVSLFAYMLLLVVAVTVVRKWFGNMVAVIFISLSSLLTHAVRYNVEVRMYSWCQLFTLLVFLLVYQILRKVKERHVSFGHYLWMTVFSLGAVYSHYFAMATVGILYLVVLVYMFRVCAREVWKVILSGSMVIAGLLPWVLYCYATKGLLMTDYHIEQVGWKACFEYIFSSPYSMLLLMAFFVTFVLAFCRETGMLQICDLDGGKKSVRMCPRPDENTSWTDFVWMFAGTVAVLGTIAAAQFISSLFYPIITLRYFYPCFCIMWLLLGINISKCKLRKWYAAALMILLLISCVPQYLKTVREEKNDAERVVTTLEATAEVNNESFIITNDRVVNWQLALYYPQASSQLSAAVEFSEMDLERDNWLFLTSPITDDMKAQLKEMDCKATLIVEKGFISCGNLWIYRISEASE